MARPYVITIACEKGGVGKTTLATNLAIYLKGLAEDLPVTLFSFDNHFTIDRMFQLQKGPDSRHVGQLFNGTPPRELIKAGQYGVQIIPSCRELYELQSQVEHCGKLAQILSSSELQGLVIIDTSPILDIYTRNAIYAADRVIVPIKDAPSLENCRNLSRFLGDQGLSKKALRLLPCLIDTRIRFEGPFQNAYQLIKAYAINRGYRCYEGFIAKSPKVESLNTNPEGKIYPIISHGRNTGVHLQFTHLARQVYLDYLQNGPLRMTEVADQQDSQASLLAGEYRQRLARIAPTCLCCDTPIPESGVWSGAFYLESGDGTTAGFAEETCFLDMILQDCYGEERSQQLVDSLRDLLVGSAEGSYILLQQTPLQAGEWQLDYYRLDGEGEKLSGRSLLLRDRNRFGVSLSSKLLQLFDKIDAEELSGGHKLLLARRTGREPVGFLQHRPYLEWQTVFSRIRVDLAAENELVTGH